MSRNICLTTVRPAGHVGHVGPSGAHQRWQEEPTASPKAFVGIIAHTRGGGAQCLRLGTEGLCNRYLLPTFHEPGMNPRPTNSGGQNRNVCPQGACLPAGKDSSTGTK